MGSGDYSRRSSICGIVDYGADRNAFPLEILKTLKKYTSGIMETELMKPIELDAAIELPIGTKFTASSSVRLNILVKLLCGKLSQRNVGFCVIDQPMNELLLGRRNG